MIIWSSINCPTVIYSSTVCYFSRKKPLEKSTAPGLLFNTCLRDLFLFVLLSDLLIQKYTNTLLQFLVIYFNLRTCEIYLSSLLQLCQSFYPWGTDNPSHALGASIWSLCARVVHVVHVAPIHPWCPCCTPTPSPCPPPLLCANANSYKKEACFFCANIDKYFQYLQKLIMKCHP